MLGFGVAFVLMIVSAYLLFEGNTKSSLKLVWSSVVVSGVAMLAALGSLLFPRR